LDRTGDPTAPMGCHPAGSGRAIDVMVRASAGPFEQRNPYAFVVESRAGADTIIAANACKAARPTAARLPVLAAATVSINPQFYKKGLRSDQGFRPITKSARDRCLFSARTCGEGTSRKLGRPIQGARGQAQFGSWRGRRHALRRGVGLVCTRPGRMRMFPTRAGRGQCWVQVSGHPLIDLIIGKSDRPGSSRG